LTAKAGRIKLAQLVGQAVQKALEDAMIYIFNVVFIC
jgi:maltooligosyltrehalose synthase